MNQNPLVRFFEGVVPLLEEYRDKNINKYYREKEAPDSEYTKCERYKNRVRVVDCVLGPMKDVLKDAGVLRGSEENDEREIP